MKDLTEKQRELLGSILDEMEPFCDTPEISMALGDIDSGGNNYWINEAALNLDGYFEVYVKIKKMLEEEPPTETPEIPCFEGTRDALGKLGADNE